MEHSKHCDMWNCEKCKELVGSDKEIVHCIEMSPGIYMVSAKFRAELEKQVQKTTWKGSIFGVEILESDHLPMIIEKTKEKFDEKTAIFSASRARTELDSSTEN